MANIITGAEYTFAYPKELTALPEYTAHANHKVIVLRKMPLSETGCDNPMWEIQAKDGWIGYADGHEITHVKCSEK